MQNQEDLEVLHILLELKNKVLQLIQFITICCFPAAFGSIEESYHHLKEHVQIWDVAAERQVEISGKDSAKLVQLMTCRDLSKSKDGRCYYCPIIDDNAGLINDPVVLRINENKWWISIADTDVILFAKGLAIGNKFDVEIIEPKVDIMAVQGPKSFKLMEKVFGEQITKLKFLVLIILNLEVQNTLSHNLDGLNKEAMKYMFKIQKQA